MSSTVKSEVACLLGQIRVEYEAAQRGLNGFAEGHTRHHFISARYSAMGALGKKIEALVGHDASIALMFDAVNGAEEQSASI